MLDGPVRALALKAVPQLHHQPEFAYALHPLPPNRSGVRRWRWELWQGAALVAAGWRLSQQHAERALCAAASRRGHAQLGLYVLHPDRGAPPPALAMGAQARVDCGAFECLLVPRLPGAAGWTPAVAV
jgi:hypothetical protein